MKYNYHWFDQEGNPAGGMSQGTGYTISWQNGPIKESGGINGAFVENVLRSVVNRLEYYQDSKFACEANETALAHIDSALKALEERTKERESRGVEGTHEI